MSKYRYLEDLFIGKHAIFFFKARNAIEAGIEAISLSKDKNILFPNYYCGSELDVLRSKEVRIIFYPVEESTFIKVENLAQLVTANTAAIYVTHYFGLTHPNIKEIKDLCIEKGIWLIEDCALNLLTANGGLAGGYGDLTIFSLRKFLRVRSGGVLLVNSAKLRSQHWHVKKLKKLTKAREWALRVTSTLLGRNMKSRLRKFVASFRRSKSVMMLDRHPIGNLMPETYYYDSKTDGWSMDPYVRRTLKRTETTGIARVRRRNYLYLAQKIRAETNLTLLFDSLVDEMVPLNLPIKHEKAAKIVDLLKDQGVETSHWWYGVNKYFARDINLSANNLKNEIFTLPIHQHIKRRHLDQIVIALKTILEDPLLNDRDFLLER